VKNTGPVDGDEVVIIFLIIIFIFSSCSFRFLFFLWVCVRQVVQLYIHDEVASVVAYDKVLRGFERVPLKAGETKAVTFTLIPRHFGLIDKNEVFTVCCGV
jgi:hypothetical protein